MFERLLIAVDGSECARRAAAYGLGLADRYDADVDVVAVFGGDAKRHGREALDAVADLAADCGVPVETRVLSGRPAKAITEHAAEAGADLVVVGRRGRGGVATHLLGSVTKRVLRRVDVPVLAVPDGSLDGDTGTAYGDVLVTTDGSELAERAGPYAADVARRFGATLHALNVADVQAEAGVFDVGGVDAAYVERLEDRGTAAVSRLVDGLDASDLDVREAVVRGAAHDAIDEYVTAYGVDLVVMSSEGHSNLAGRVLGTVTGRVLRTVDVPVLVVPVE